MAKTRNDSEMPPSLDDEERPMQAPRERSFAGARPGGSAPDKRVRIDPAPCDIPPRQGGPFLF